MSAAPPAAPLTEAEATTAEIAALRRELKLTWDSHDREHKQHDAAHNREHTFTQTAVETAALMAKENKADANEWRSSMNDREAKFATKDDVRAILARLDGIERANILSDERDRQRTVDEAEEKHQAERRISRGQWVIGLTVGLMATIGAVLINLVLRLSNVP